MEHQALLDENTHEVIIFCKLNRKNREWTEIIVTYENGVTERIWTFNHNRYNFDFHDFVGMTKIEAVFYCDRMAPSNI